MKKTKETAWHNLSWKKAVESLKTDPEKGLSEKEAKARLKKAGLNKLPEEKPFPKTKIFLAQFKSPLIYILLIAGIMLMSEKIAKF